MAAGKRSLRRLQTRV
ncbi:zinc finger protein 483 [Rhinolophus ferrumequinum]|uniref:Zinc finger protein 483 n=1 Tax=Rhinolophus ferrumequinum TaxID=59479 RepID=A0A7J7VTM7_RHIFE|nr:zinc finger protein 483 [Rhinolophus ferrumequinum]